MSNHEHARLNLVSHNRRKQLKALKKNCGKYDEKEEKNYIKFRNIVFKNEKLIKPGHNTTKMKGARYTNLKKAHEKFRDLEPKDLLGNPDWDAHREEM